MKLLFELGPFSIHFFGIMIAAGVLVAYLLVQKEARRLGYDVDKVINTGIGALIGGLFGARIFYILFYNLEFYLSNPSQVFAIHQGGLSIHGGIVGGLLVGWFFARAYRLSFWALADLYALPLILAQAIGRVGCDVFGKPMATEWPWGIIYNGALVHPVQLYEFLLNLGLFWFLWKRRKRQKQQGTLFLWYAAGFLIIRGIIEFFRINPQVFGQLSVSHLITLVGLVVVIGAGLLLNRPGYKLVERQKFSAITALVVLSMAAVGIVLYYAIHLLV